MSLARFDLHGLSVDVRSSLVPDPAAALLAGFARGEARREPDLAILLRPASGGDPGAPDGRRLFFHGSVHAAPGRSGGIALFDGASRIDVSADGRTVEAAVHPASLEDGNTFADVALTIALVLALRRHGLFHLHAAALTAPGGTPILVPGQGGSGKTTTALALRAGGAELLADDAVFLARRGGAPALLPFPRALHLGEATARAFPSLASALGAMLPSGKRTLGPSHALPVRLPEAAGTPGLLLFPSIERAARTQLRPLSPAEALGALLESSALLVVDGIGAVPDHLDVLRAVADHAKPFTLRLGADVLEDPARAGARILRAAASQP